MSAVAKMAEVNEMKIGELSADGKQFDVYIDRNWAKTRTRLNFEGALGVLPEHNKDHVVYPGTSDHLMAGLVKGNFNNLRMLPTVSIFKGCKEEVTIDGRTVEVKFSGRNLMQIVKEDPAVAQQVAEGTKDPSFSSRLTPYFLLSSTNPLNGGQVIHADVETGHESPDFKHLGPALVTTVRVVAKTQPRLRPA